MKYLLLLGAVPAILLLGTIIEWGFRYIWLGIEVVPSERVGIAFLLLILFFPIGVGCCRAAFYTNN